MLTLFYDLKNSGRLSDTLLVGRNLFNRNPANEQIFAAYYDFLCQLAESIPALSERKDFAGQASIALAFFTENVELNTDTINRIGEYKVRLENIEKEIAAVDADRAKAAAKEAKLYNDARLKTLYELKDELRSCKKQDAFDEALSKVGVIDGEIHQDVMSAEQRRIYESLTKEITELISKKMHEFEYKSDVAYNKKAVDAFARAFQEFRRNESKYKNQNQLYDLASKTLFAFDASRLFNETLIYYNHIYSYIFSVLDDDGKLALTRYSIECERNLR